MRAFRPLLLAVLTWLAFAAPVVSQDAGARISRADAREFAITLLRNREPLAAREIAIGLLRADVKDVAALNILGQAELALGRVEAAEAAGREAFRLAGDEDLQRFTAAFTVAEALSRQGKLTAAQLWLRRAGEATGDERLENAAKQVYRGVEAANPWRITGSLSLMPSSNVNNGSEEAAFGLLTSAAALPLEGWSLNTSATVERTFRPDASHEYTIGVSARDRRVFLTTEAKNSPMLGLPPLENDDFSSSAASLSFGTRFQPADSKAIYQVRATASRDWRGGGAYLNSYNLLSARSWVQGRQRRNVSLSYTRQNRLDSDNLSANIWTVRGGLSFPVENGSIAFDAQLSDTTSSSPLVAHTSISAGTSYGLNEPIFGLQPTLSARLTHRDYDDISPLFLERRVDTEVSLGVDFAAPGISVLGFIPTVGVTAMRNSSTVAAYQTEQIGLSFGYRSSF
ncbi:MAG: hypothetical protein MK180_01925 [Rhodobacteraceae bacterium]|nr:hypothetical protein [Paracoccaceae bacterium]